MISFAPFKSTALTARLGLVAALGAVALAAPVADAGAAVVNVNTTISVPNNFDGVYLNLLTGTTGSSGAGTAGWDINLYNSGTTLSFFFAATPSQASAVASTTTGPYLDLPLGSVISAASTFAQVTAGTATAAFQTTGNHILGVRFYNESTAAVNYGYLRLTSTATSGFPLTITGWSYENTGAAITVAAIPEPGTYALMAAGLALVGGIAARRRKAA